MHSALRRTTTGLVLGSSCLLAATAAAQSPAASLSLAEAVRLASDRAPRIQRARADVRSEEGARLEASGSFNSILRLKPSLEINESELDSRIRSAEELRRRVPFSLAGGDRLLREDLERKLALKQLRIPPCPPEYNTIRLDAPFFLDGRDPRFQGGPDVDLPDVFEIICVPLEFGISDLDTLLLRVQNSVFRPTRIENNIDLQRLINSILLVGNRDLIEDVRQRGIEEIERALRTAIDTEEQDLRTLFRLGAAPRDLIRKTAAFDVGVEKPLRNGTAFSLQYQYSGVEENYRGKPLDAAFGGRSRNEFRTEVTLGVSQPLGKQRGRTSAAAAESAAMFRSEGARHQQAHSISESVFETVRAYVDVAAAQETASLLEESAFTNRRIRDATEQLFRAGDKARSDVTRADARLAEVETSGADAKVLLLAARNNLARAVGVTLQESGVGPSATLQLPLQARTPNLDTLRRGAGERRNDLRASRAFTAAAAALTKAADADLAHRCDLSIRGGAHTRYLGPYFRVLKDEFKAAPREPRESPIEYFSPKGFWRSLRARWRPGFEVKLTFDVPFKNNAARGRLMQADASYRRSQTQERDLARRIDQNVEGSVEALRRAVEEVGHRHEAAQRHKATWDASEALRAAGQLSMVDTLLTERDWTNARVQLVLARRDYAEALARLRFEAGALVAFDRNGEPTAFDLEGLIAEPPPAAATPRAEELPAGLAFWKP